MGHTFVEEQKIIEGAKNVMSFNGNLNVFAVNLQVLRLFCSNSAAGPVVMYNVSKQSLTQLKQLIQ